MSVFTGGPYGRLAIMLNTLSSLNIEIIIIIIIINIEIIIIIITYDINCNENKRHGNNSKSLLGANKIVRFLPH